MLVGNSPPSSHGVLPEVAHFAKATSGTSRSLEVAQLRQSNLGNFGIPQAVPEVVRR